MLLAFFPFFASFFFNSCTWQLIIKLEFYYKIIIFFFILIFFLFLIGIKKSNTFCIWGLNLLGSHSKPHAFYSGDSSNQCLNILRFAISKPKSLRQGIPGGVRGCGNCIFSFVLQSQNCTIQIMGRNILHLEWQIYAGEIVMLWILLVGKVRWFYTHWYLIPKVTFRWKKDRAFTYKCCACAAQGMMDSAVINSNHPALDLFRNFQEYGNIYF